MEAKLASIEEQSRTFSLLAEEEARIIKTYLLAALIKHAFNIFSLVTIATYIFLFWGALKYYPLFYAVLEIAFMTPYFWLMHKSLPILKSVYIEKYATEPADARDVLCGVPAVNKMESPV